MSASKSDWFIVVDLVTGWAKGSAIVYDVVIAVDTHVNKQKGHICNSLTI